MINEYALVPDIFDSSAYSNPVFIEMCLPHLKEPLLQEALVRDLCDGGWSQYCRENSGSLHRLCKEIIKKLVQSNRLRRFPRQAASIPTCAADWCQEGINASTQEPITGIIAAHTTKQAFPTSEVASIEKITGTQWWQNRSPSVTVDRKTADYIRVLHLVLMQANSLMFIDPNLDPNTHNYREFAQILRPIANRAIKPRIEIHRSFCKGDGPGRTFPGVDDWKVSFAALGQYLSTVGIQAEVFGWDDFHARFLISDVIGISAEAGFDVTGKPDDYSVWTRLGREDKDSWQRKFDPASRPESLKWRFAIGNRGSKLEPRIF